MAPFFWLCYSAVMKGFLEQEVRELVGTSVIKRVLQPENPAVKPGDKGTVEGYEPSGWADGFAVIVRWPGDELWVYDTPESFAEDAEIERRFSEKG